MKNEIVVPGITPDREEVLSKAMGENQLRRPSTLMLPLIRLNGETGKFVRVDVTKEGYGKGADIGPIFSGVVVRVRCKLQEFSKQYRRESNEFENPAKDKVSLFEIAGGTRTLIEKDKPVKEVRVAYPGLRALRLLYIWVPEKNELVKLTVKGMGLTKLFEFFQELPENEHLFKMLLEFQPVLEKNDMGKTFWAIQPIKKDPITPEQFDVVEKHILNIAANIKKLQEFYAEKPEEVAKVEGPAPVEVAAPEDGDEGGIKESDLNF